MGIHVFDTLKKAFAGRSAEAKNVAAAELADAGAAAQEVEPAVERAQRISDRYPGVAKIAINLSSRASFEKTEPTIRGFSMGPDALANFVFRCKNTECIDGGFELTDEIDQMVESFDTNAHGRRVCQGWNGKDNIGHQRCYYELNFVINVSYASGN